MLAKLSPEERVGQLFLVTFQGIDVGEGQQIYDLIVNHHIGGVFLLAANDNFIDGEEALAQLLSMNRQLQLNRWAVAQQPQVDPRTNESITYQYIPLFIGTQQEGDGYPNDQILSGVTPLPNEMAMGATWNTALVHEVGIVLGQELATLGINMLFGPSLDVLETPRPESGSDLGTRTFGGDPFWVSENGRAFISGVHTGSADKIAVVAKHFPGNGGADRSAEEEVATVRKSLEQLTKFDLAPFYAVTGQAPNIESSADALLASHIRYQGFQENIRATTRPVSFDPQAFNSLMNLPPLATWRQAGGLMISDNLGSRAVRRFYELSGQAFEARRVALNAFLAGNDLLYIGDLSSNDDPDPYPATVRTLEFFAQKYREDAAFARRIDESVLRILTLKFRLYPSFTLSSTLPPLDDLSQLGKSSQITFDVAQQAATLLSPSLAELESSMPDPPSQTEKIVFLTSTRLTKQCSTCPEQPVLATDALQEAVMRLYGPQASNQVLSFNLKSYPFIELYQMLDETRFITQLERDLSRAQWIVFAMLNENRNSPESQALPRFLAERPDLFQQKKLVVFAFNAPYYLDATNISKISAYYGLFSKTSDFVDVAARLLFREIRPRGALPVSVPGIGYDLIIATSPDPNQVIQVVLDTPEMDQIKTPTTQPPTPTPDVRIGNTIPIRTGIILDRNGHPVPDQTPVQFIVLIDGEISGLPTAATTIAGIARTTIQVSSAGNLEIRAESEPAKQSIPLVFEIPAEFIEARTPTATFEPTATVTPSPSPTSPSPVSTPIAQTPLARPNLVDWSMALLVVSLISISSYRLSAQIGQVRWGIRGSFLALIGGLMAYTYLALKMPGSQNFITSSGAWGIVLTTGLGAFTGLAFNWIWRRLRKPSNPSITT